MNRRNFILASSIAFVAQRFSLGALGRTLNQQPRPGKTFSLNGKRARVYTTAANTQQRISLTDTLSFRPVGQPKETQVCVFVDPRRQFQTFLGIGGALTDAAAEVFAMLPAAKQRELLNAYFDDEKGIGYKLARTNIHSCDFSSSSYTYVAEGDKELKSFSIEHDWRYRIPLIKQAIAASRGRLNIFASPWSPPAFMKDNRDILHGGSLKPDFYQAWANYFAKFIKAYRAAGVPIWGITIQNEPMATQKWESCIYTAEQERDFLKNHLGPTLRRQGLADKKIIAWDHNRDLIYQRASTILSDPQAAKYVWGIGFHWYEPWSGGEPMFDNVKLVSETFPDKALIFTEGCVDAFDAKRIREWKFGEQYGRSMIHDFNNGTVGWTDWNILLDERGGPNHVNNFCFAPVHANTKTGELTYLSSFYYIGHFSRFIKPGAKRIASSSSRSQLLSTAFQNPDGRIVVVVMNQSEANASYWLWVAGQAADVVSPARSIQTLVF